MEKWRWIDGYVGLYLVSDHGNVISLPKHGKDAVTLKPISDGRYLGVTLYSKEGKPTRELVHRLVAKAFCMGYEPSLEVNHKDGDKTNNKADNLEWITRSENMKHSARILGGGHIHKPQRMFTDDQIRDIRNSSMGTRPIARLYGVSPNAISQIRKRKTYQEVI